MSKKIPLRMCVGCMLMKEKTALIRVLRDPEGVFSIDATGRKNGRGAYICNDPACLEKAIKNHGLERSFKVSIPKDTIDLLKKEMDSIENG